MKALVYHGARDVRVDTVPDPTPPDARGAVVRVERAAICGSDLHLYHGAFPDDLAGFTIGHEFVGEVVETGSAVRALRTGQRVMVSAVVGCGECPECLRGEVVCCATAPSQVFGTGPGLQGGQAEAVAIPAADHACRPIPDGIDIEQAVLLTDILPTGFFGARNADIRPGQTVVIIGLGPVGQLALMSAQLYGPSKILAVDRVPERLAAARDQGAIPIDADGDVRHAILEHTNGRGPDAVIEAVGADETIQLALEIVRVGGVVSVVGVNLNFAFPLNMASAFMKNLTFRIGLVPVQELWPSLVPLVASGRLSPEVVFTHRMPLSEGPRGYEIFDGRADGVMKVLLDPTR
jgi:2-desacetyl-2-hydroxyethyl bacteriochlorophyllide A dehydrogenase